MDYKHSIKRQIINDYKTFHYFSRFVLFLIFSIALFVMGINLAKQNKLNTIIMPEFMIFGLVLAIVSGLFLLFFFFRIKIIKYYFNDDIKLEGEIVTNFYSIFFSYIEYMYKIENKTFYSGNKFYIKKTLKYFKIRDKIEIIVDPKNYKKSIIKYENK